MNKQDLVCFLQFAKAAHLMQKSVFEVIQAYSIHLKEVQASLDEMYNESIEAHEASLF